MAQERRVAENEALFREVNERVSDLNQTLPPALDATWICECANTGCVERVELAPEEYEAVRAHPARFLVYPNDSHVAAGVERVVERYERYWVLEKVGGEGRRIAVEEDPRAE